MMHLSKLLSTYYKYPAAILLLILLSFSVIAQKKIPEDFCISNKEHQLYEMVNLLRIDYGKKKVQLSKSLSYVAKLHVGDLQINNPDTSICNLSSWSDKGAWTPCCYNKYVHNPDCMWDKPKELTPYTYRGYELVTFIEDDLDVDSIINLWSNSREVLDMILTRGNYSKKKWICGGVGINEHYVSLWFGQRKDNLGEPEICKDDINNSDINSVVVTTNQPTTYYLIFGSHNNMHDAREGRKKVKSDFKNSDILIKNDKYRVYLDKFNNLKEAMHAKQQLPMEYREAWILKD